MNQTTVYAKDIGPWLEKLSWSQFTVSKEQNIFS